MVKKNNSKFQDDANIEEADLMVSEVEADGTDEMVFRSSETEELKDRLKRLEVENELLRKENDELINTNEMLRNQIEQALKQGTIQFNPKEVKKVGNFTVKTY